MTEQEDNNADDSNPNTPPMLECPTPDPMSPYLPCHLESHFAQSSPIPSPSLDEGSTEPAIPRTPDPRRSPTPFAESAFTGSTLSTQSARTDGSDEEHVSRRPSESSSEGTPCHSSSDTPRDTRDTPTPGSSDSGYEGDEESTYGRDRSKRADSSNHPDVSVPPFSNTSL